MFSTKRETCRIHRRLNLRQSLIDAAIAILSEEPTKDFSLRKVAARVGVSHAAPYRHFAHRHQLIQAVIVVGMKNLVHEMRNAKAGAFDTKTLFLAISHAYIAFAKRNPTLYRMMFGHEFSDAEPGDKLSMIEDADAAAVIREFFQSIVDKRNAKIDLNIDLVVVACWSTLHGLATWPYGKICERAVLSEDLINSIMSNCFESFVMMDRSA